MPTRGSSPRAGSGRHPRLSFVTLRSRGWRAFARHDDWKSPDFKSTQAVSIKHMEPTPVVTESGPVIPRHDLRFTLRHLVDTPRYYRIDPLLGDVATYCLGI